VYPLLSGKPRTYVKRPLLTDRVILRLALKNFALKGIRILDLMELSQRPKPLPPESFYTKFSKFFYFILSEY
jgi:hypothetical protein